MLFPRIRPSTTRTTLVLMLFGLVLSTLLLPHPGEAAEPIAASAHPLFQRALPEALVPVGRAPTAAETQALETALRHYRHGSNREDVTALTDYLERHRNSPWRIALLTNLGLIYYDTAQFSKALAAFDRAWQAGKRVDAEGPAKALVDRALGELVRMHARLGQKKKSSAGCWTTSRTVH